MGDRMSELINSAEIRVVGDATGVEEGFRPAIQAAQRVGQAITQVAANSAAAAESVQTSQGRMTEAVRRSSAQIETSERNLIATTQRAIAAAEAGSRSGSAFIESLARTRNVDPSGALAPYLARLREVEQAQNRAGSSAGQVANAMRQVPAQLNDIAVQLAGGQSPFLVLLQQGSQLRDSFGSVSAAAEGVAASIAGIVSPLLVLGAAAAGVGYAMYKGAEEQRAWNNALVVTSNYAGTTTYSMGKLAESMTQTHEVTIGVAKDIAFALTSSGKIGGEAISTIGHLISDFAISTGQSVETLAPKMISLFAEPTKGAAELNSTMHFLTTSQIEHIAALERTGQVQKAQNELAQAAAAHMPKQVENLGFVTKAINDQRDAWTKLIDKIKEWGKTPTGPEQQAQALRDQISEYLASGLTRQHPAVKAVQLKLDALEPAIQKQKELTQAEKDAAAANELQAKSWDQVKASSTAYHIQELRDQLKLIEAHKSEPGANFAAQEAAKRDAIRKTNDEIEAAERSMGAEDRQLTQQKITQQEQLALLKLKGVAETLDTQLKLGIITKQQFDMNMTNNALEANLVEQTFERRMSHVSGLTKAERQAHIDKLVMLQEEFNQIERKGANASDIEDKKAYDEIIKATLEAGAVSIKSLDDQIEKQRQHNAEIGKTREEIERERQAVVDLNIVQMESDANFIRNGLETWGFDEKANAVYRARLALLDEEIEKLKIRSALHADGAVLEANAKAAADASAAWKRAAGVIENDLTQAILDGGGRGWKKLIRDMEFAFARMILQPVLQPISGNVASYLYPAAAQAQGVAGGGLVGAAQVASNIYGIATGGMTLAGGLGTGFMGSLAGGLSGAGMGSGLTSSLGLSIGNGILDVVGPGISGALASGMGAIATALPWVGGAVAVASLWKSAFGHGDTEVQGQGIRGTLSASGVSGQSYQKLHQDGGWFSSDRNWEKATGFTDAMSKQFTNGLQSMETAAASFASSLGVSAEWVTTYSKTFDLAVTGDATKDQQIIADFFSGVGDEIANKLVPNLADFAKSGEAASATLERLAGDFKGTDQVAQLLGRSASVLFGATGIESAKARENLIDLAGGLSTLSSEASFFNQNFLTDAERIKPVAEALDKALGSLGLDTIPTTRDEFKSLINSLIDSGAAATDAGGKQLTSLLALSEAFAQVHPQIDAAADAAAKAAAALQAMKDSASTLLGGVDDAFSALQKVVAREKTAVQASVTAQTAAVAKLQTLSQALRSTLDSLKSPDQKAAERVSAQAQIRAALAIAKAGGALPTADSLKAALSAVTQDAADQFSSSTDYLRDLYQTQNDLSQLADLTDSSLSVEQQSLDALQAQLSRLDDMVAQGQEQIDALKGQSVATLTLAQAMAGLQTAITGAQANPIVGATSGIANMYQQLLGRQADQAGLEYWQSAIASGSTLDSIRDSIMQSIEYKALHPFAAGTNSVPEDMPAFIHKGERIIPAADNRALMARLANPTTNADVLAAAVDRLTAQVAQQQEVIAEMADDMAKMAGTLGGASVNGGVLRVKVIN